MDEALLLVKPNIMLGSSKETPQNVNYGEVDSG